jgi:hypothetical protein
MSNTIGNLAIMTAAVVGVGYVLHDAGYIGNPFEKFDNMSQQQLDHIALEGPVTAMYNDWTSVTNSYQKQVFMTKWSPKLAKSINDVLPLFFRIWMGRHPTLAADVQDRLTYLNLDSKNEDHTEDVFHDSRLQVAERRKRNEALIWRMYSPEILRPLEV